jgi:hypothetical protein
LYCGLYIFFTGLVVHFSRILYTEDMCLHINQFIKSLKLQNELLSPNRNNC